MQYTLKCNLRKHSVLKTLNISWNQLFFMSQLSFTNSSQETKNIYQLHFDEIFSVRFFFREEKKMCKKCAAWTALGATARWTECYLVMDRFLCCRQSLKNSSRSSATHWATCTPKCGGGWCFRSCAQRFWLYVAQWSKIANFVKLKICAFWNVREVWGINVWWQRHLFGDWKS